MVKAQKIVEIAISQLGYEEPNHDNYNKYSKEIDTTWPDFYNGKKDGFDWCTCFVHWCFLQSFGESVTLQILNLPRKSSAAGVKYFWNYLEAASLISAEPVPGSVVFFRNSKGLCHVGIVTAYDGYYVETVEGNSGPGSYFVYKHKYKKTDTYIHSYGVPKYDEKPEPAPTQKYIEGGLYSVVCKDDLMIRGGAGTDNPVLSSLKSGDLVICEKVEKDKAGNTWLKITGYACAEYGKEIYIK